MIYASDKIALFVDGANLFASTRNLNFNTDYKRMLEYFSEQATLVRAYYYTAMLNTDRDEHNPLRKMVDYLDYNGWTVVTKFAKEFTSDAGVRKIKGNMDIELATDMLDAVQYCDHIILVTGDGDFKYVIDAIKRRGVRVTVVSTIETSPPMCADELRRAADSFIDLVTIQDAIMRPMERIK